jgi:hypothetical protein
VASTGENWDYDWTGNTLLASAGGGLPAMIPAGGEITSGSGILIPALQPGQSTTLVQPWSPVNPKEFEDEPDDLNVCLLARIVNPAAANDGMTFAEQFSKEIIHNVRPNNNIFTRNLWVKDLNAGNRSARTRVVISNAEDEAKVFDVQFINERAINPHFAGNFSQIGYVKLYLGDLYDIWLAEGSLGSYLDNSDEERSVTMDGSQTLELLNLPLDANAKYPVDVEFLLHDEMDLPNYRYDFHLRQFAVIDGERSEDVYGSMSFQINTRAETPARKANTGLLREATNTRFSIYPNPAKDNLTISYQGDNDIVADIVVTDVMGRVVLKKSSQHFNKSHIDIPVKSLPTGVYIVEIADGKGMSQREKFIKE